MQVAILLVHVLLAIGLIALVLIQQGKGAEAGAAFGGGASQTVFGSRGSTSFLSRLTGILAALFFATSLGLAWFANQGSGDQDSGIPDAQVIEQQRNSVPRLDDNGTNGGANGAAAGDAAAPTGDQPASSEENSAPALDDAPQDQHNAAPALEDNGNANQPAQ